MDTHRIGGDNLLLIALYPDSGFFTLLVAGPAQQRNIYGIDG